MTAAEGTEGRHTSARDFLRDASRQAIGPTLVIVPAPAGEALGVLESMPDVEAWLFWRQDSDSAARVVLGLGAACTDGLASAALTRAIHPEASSALASRLPLTFAGRAFDHEAPISPGWEPFGRGATVVPRWTYVREGGAAVLALLCELRGPRDVDRALLELDAIVSALAAPRPTLAAPRLLSATDTTSFAEWQVRVACVRAAIAANEVEKVVLARRRDLRFEGAIAPEALLASLPSRGTTRFLVRRGGATFLGASPERLFALRGRRLETEALAGTRPRGAAEAERGLLESDKDRDEHAPVVRAISEVLAALGARVRLDPQPHLVRLANVVHLRTAIEADLPEGASAMDLLSALHPTPAVSGSPRQAALAFLRANEEPRGWYAGPLAVLDARGDAEVLVMLRCALVQDTDVQVFAGAGIVAASDATSEWVETEVKMAPVLDALGAGRSSGMAACAELSGNESKSTRGRAETESRGEVRV